MDSQIDEIKNKLNIIDVVGSYIKLQKTGINYRGVCPFHSEKKPSFFVSPSRQMFKCFGCGAGHSMFDFVMKIEGVEFGDALRILAAKAGIELKKENPKLRTERQRLYEICDLACSFFQKQLEASTIGKEAKDYLIKRGINQESINKWRLGYSPDTWQGLSDFLVGKGYHRKEIISAGLAVEKEDKSNSYDRFRGRIIFPVFDANSQVIGFGARVFKTANEKETAKYINTPQTLLYDKSNTLYGLNNAKVAIRKSNQCVITEGYTDTIMSHQAGFENTVASSGTALTPQHLNILKRYTENLIMAFDMDLAGDNATKRGINLAENLEFNIKVVNAYSVKDPADIILENPEIWKNSLESARSIMDYYFDSAFGKYNKADPKGKKEIGRIILPAIKRLRNKIEQAHWVQKLSQKLDVAESAIMEELRSVIPAKAGIHGVDSGSRSGMTLRSREDLIKQKIIALVAKDPESMSLIDQEIKVWLGDFSATPEDAIKAEAEFAEDGAEELQICLAELRELNRRAELSKISNFIKLEQDQQKKEDLIKEFNKKAKDLHAKEKK